MPTPGIMEFDNNTICREEARNNDRFRLPRWHVIGTKGSVLVKNRKDYIWDEIELKYQDKDGREKREIIKIPDAKRFTDDI